VGYHGGTLAPLFEPELAQKAVADMADDGGDWLLDRIVEFTPTSHHAHWAGMLGFGAERERAPGTLKRSWYREPGVWRVRRGAYNGYEAKVATNDPIAPYVEDDTRPHIIRAKPGKSLRFRAWPTGEVVYARFVRHPGTTGRHMVLSAEAAAKVSFALICEPRLQRWAVEQARHAMRANPVHVGDSLVGAA
jgi:hypothetical protein